MAITVESAIQKAKELEKLNAFISVISHPSPDESGEPTPFTGVPFVVNDNISVAGLPLTNASEQYEGRVASRNAKILQPLLDAGAVVIGKTNIDELGYGATGEHGVGGPVANPWDFSRISGGASSGAAAAVAAGIVPFAIGTDSGGSTRIPASLCGVWAFKPTHSADLLNGVHILSESMDTVGVMATSSTWLVRVWRAVIDARVTTPRDPKIAWLSGAGIAPIDEQVRELTSNYLEPVLTTCYEAPWLSNLLEAYRPLKSAETYATHEPLMNSAPDKFQQRTLNMLALDQSVRGWQYFKAQNCSKRLRHDLLHIFDEVDYLAMPTTPIVAPKIGKEKVTIGENSYSTDKALHSLTAAWSVLGWPVLCVPAGHINGMPVGVQIIGRPGSDNDLLGMASYLAGALSTPTTTAQMSLE